MHPEIRSANRLLIALSTVFFLVEWLPGILGQYGYFIDEFYYLACADHIAPGYVDHPPLSIFILAAWKAIAGDSLAALRFLPALAGGITVFVVGLIARRLGAGTPGQVIAAVSAMVGLIYDVSFSFYSMNAYSILLWALCFLVLVEIERRGEPRLWLLVGILAGLALENKHTFILLPVGLAVGMLTTGARRHYADRWFWYGCAAALLLFLPNLLWQAANGWPSLEFYRNADFYKNVPTPPMEVLMWQFLTMNPGAAPVWLCGLGFLLFSKAGKPYRHLGWVYVVLLGLMLVGQKSRPDRIAEAYIILMAAGGTVIGQWSGRSSFAWLRYGVIVLLAVSWVALAPMGIPVLPPETMSRYAATLGLVPQIEAGEGKRTDIPQWMADRLGWEQLADDVEQAARMLTPGERSRSFILAPSYGQAGAIELLGRGKGLPPVYGIQNSYWHWGPPPDSAVAAIVVGPISEETVRRVFGDVELAGIHDCQGCMRWRDEVPIWLCRQPKVRISEVWPAFRYYE